MPPALKPAGKVNRPLSKCLPLSYEESLQLSSVRRPPPESGKTISSVTPREFLRVSRCRGFHIKKHFNVTANFHDSWGHNKTLMCPLVSAALISTTRGSGAGGGSRVNDLIASMGRTWRRARAALITTRPRCLVKPADHRSLSARTKTNSTACWEKDGFRMLRNLVCGRRRSHDEL